FGYALAVLPGGLLADKIGYRKTIIGSLLALAITTAAMGMITDYTMGLVIRFLMGAVSGPIQSSCLSALGHNFSMNQRGTAVGIFMSCTSFGVFTVNLYAPTVAMEFGWRAAFFVTALLPLIVMFACFFTLKAKQTVATVSDAVNKLNGNGSSPAVGGAGTANGVGELTDHGVESVMDHGVTPNSIEQAAEAAKPTLLENLKYLFTTRNVLLLAVAGMFATGTTWGVTNWANLYMVKQLGVSAVFAGSVMSLYGFAAFLAKPTIGIISDNIPVKKNYTAAAALFCFSPALWIFANTTNPNMLYVTAPILGVGAFMYSAVTNALIVQSAPEHLRATTAGFVNTFNQIGAITAPMILGGILTSTGSYQTALMSIAAFPILGALALTFVKLTGQEK
ncbi:MAG: MFS transporter, partial [Negativicutes bacterium]|nr:MFS transporter [Negativicutes bacterium]